MKVSRTVPIALAVACFVGFSSIASAGERLLVVGGWDYGEAVFARAASSVDMSAEFATTEETGEITVEQLVRADVVFLLNLEPKGAVSLQARLVEARRRKPELQVLALDRRGSQKGIEQAGLLVRDENIRRYWRYNGFENTRRLLTYVRVEYLDAPGKIEPPEPVPDHGIYHPDAPSLFADVSAFTQWTTANAHYREAGPHVALLVQQSFLITGDTKVYDAIIAALKERGVNVAVIFARDPGQQQALLDAWNPELLIDDAHASPSLKAGAESRDVPMLKSVALLRSTVDQWRASPQGMLPADVGLHFLTQEVHGIIDPVLVGALKADTGGYKLHEPIADRVERLAGRVVAWLALRSKKNADKKIAVIYYNKYLGRDDVGRGSATGAFLDGPESLYRTLVALRERGYAFEKFPEDADQLLRWMRRDGRNLGNWADGELASLVREGNPVLIPQARYAEWFTRLRDANREMVIEAFGPPPGAQMVWGTEKDRSIVLPRIDLGNVVLLPQPARGPENDPKLLHSRDVPPPHQYLAMYWWLQDEFQADAVIHFGTHGTELLLPGKANGLSGDCFGDICLGNMPNITPWIIDNIAEAMLAKRRAYAVTVDHLCPPLEAAGLSPELRNLHADIHKFDGLAEGPLKEKYRKSISAAARKAALSLESADATADLSDDEIEKLAGRLHQIESSVTAVTLHVLGLEPERKHLIPYLASMLGESFLDDLGKVLPVPPEVAAEPDHIPLWVRPQLESLIEDIVVDGLTSAEALESAGAVIPPDDPDEVVETLGRVVEYREHFSKSNREIENVLRALEGKFVSPGPGADPVRNPGAIPTGRNLFALNPEEIPTRQAWEVGVELIDQLLREKPDLHKVAFDMNAFETIRDYGVTEAEAMYLMGVRPVWDHRNLAVDVEIIPREILGRPRVDVFMAISGSMRDHFPSRVELLDRAVRLVSQLDEPDNFVRDGTLAMRQDLEQRGFSPEKVDLYAPARIFGTKPGEYGTRILYLVPKTGAWDDREEVADVYKRNMSYVFTGDVWGAQVPGLYEKAVMGSELVLRTWTSNMTGPLTNHHTYEYAGGLSLAIESITGEQPQLMLSDVRGKPEIRDFQEVLTTEAHVTMLNPKWIRGMKESGYSGAGMMAEVVRNAAGWEATREGSVSREMWNRIHDVYVEDEYDLDLREWMNRENPHARQEILAALLEAARKGYWETDTTTRREMAQEYASSVAEYGDSGGLATGGNRKLQAEVAELLEAPGLAELVGAYRTAIAQSTTPPSDETDAPDEISATDSGRTEKTETVTGRKLVETENATPAETVAGPSADSWYLGLLALGCVLLVSGYFLGWGVPRK